MAMIGITFGSAIYGLLEMNTQAATSRLMTGATTVAQGRVDLILSVSPFNPQKAQFPTDADLPAAGSPEVETPSFDLEVGTYTRTNVPIYTDPTVNADDPEDGNVPVRATMVTEIADVSRTINGYTATTYRGKVTVSYTFRGKNYQVVMYAMRSSDA